MDIMVRKLLLLFCLVSLGVNAQIPIITSNGKYVTYNGKYLVPDTSTIPYNQSAQAFFNRWDVDAGDIRKELINDIFIALDSYGYLDSLDYLQMYAAHTQQVGNLNWLSDSITATPINSPTWTEDIGYTGVSTRYVNTNYHAVQSAINYSQNSASIGVISQTNQQSTGYLMSSLTGAGRTEIVPRNTSDNASVSINITASPAHANTNSSGILILNRPTANKQEIFRNGVSLGEYTAGPSSGVPNQDFFILCRNNNGSPQSYWVGGTASGSFAGVGLSDVAVTNITNILETYLEGLGIGVIAQSYFYENTILLACE